MADITQPTFDLFSSDSEGQEQTPKAKLKKVSDYELQQAAIAYLASKHPTAIGTSVATKYQKYQVTTAAFWATPKENNKVRRIIKTALVETCNQREQCFIECADSNSMLSAINELRDERKKLEAQIRQEEPNLADTDDLFSEFRTWRYRESENQAYIKLRKKLERLQHNLYKGSRLEHIRRARMADSLYLAVPAGMLEADEVATGWGLLHIYPDGKVEEVIEADNQNCEPGLRDNFAINIAIAATQSVLFSAGVNLNYDNPRFYRPPRRRIKRTFSRKKQ